MLPAVWKSAESTSPGSPGDAGAAVASATSSCPASTASCSARVESLPPDTSAATLMLRAACP
jgi:hypothetical protein